MESSCFMNNLINSNLGLIDDDTKAPFSFLASEPHLVAAGSINNHNIFDYNSEPLGHQSIFPSNNIASLFDALESFEATAPSTTMSQNKWSFGSDPASSSWDNVQTKQEPSLSFGSLHMDYTPELSPASMCTPATHVSPYGFDRMGMDELGASPSIQSPLNDNFGAQSSQEGGFEFDFSYDKDIDHLLAASQTDFQLFPESGNANNAEVVAAVTSLSQFLMTTEPFSSSNGGQVHPAWEESPFDSDLDYFSPLGSTCTSPTLTNFSGFDSAERSGCSPVKRPRRRRVTSEDASRMNEDGAEEARPRYQCNVCDKTFSRPFNLRSHRATHDGVRSFACSHVGEDGTVCGTAFARRHDLERHVQSRHSNVKLFPCKTCGTKCGRQDAFKRHLQRHAACALAAAKEEEERQQQASAGP
ncbi:hypothetical protein BGZ81_009139 [Podila clonocystis]|nr:hypothetical protein BGZ81_009139 [Podila clonocystis]